MAGGMRPLLTEEPAVDGVEFRVSEEVAARQFVTLRPGDVRQEPFSVSPRTENIVGSVPNAHRHADLDRKSVV
jgi:hypothetical protein